MKKMLAFLSAILPVLFLISCNLSSGTGQGQFSSGSGQEQYALNIEDPQNFVIHTSHSKKCAPSEEVTVYTTILTDVDLEMYLNGEFYAKQTAETYRGESVWAYSFPMPAKDVTVTFKTKSCEYLPLSTVCPWIDTLVPDMIDYAILEEDKGTVAPTLENFNNFTISATDAEVRSICDFLKNCVVCTTSQPIVAGANGRHLTVVLKNGQSYALQSFEGVFVIDNQNYLSAAEPLRPFSEYYGSSFVYSAAFEFTFTQDMTTEIIKIADERKFVESLIFKESEEAPEQIDYYEMCMLEGALGRIQIINDKFFKLTDTNGNAKICEIINDRSFAELVKHQV